MDIICDMMNLNKYAEIFGKKSIFIFVLTDLKRENKVDNNFVTKTKTHLLNVLRKQNFFNLLKYCIDKKTEKIQKI